MTDKKAKKDETKEGPQNGTKLEASTEVLGSGRKLLRELFGLFLLFWGLFILLSLVTYNQYDPGLNHVVSTPVPVRNQAGLFGAYLGGLLVDVFGIAAYVWPLIFIAWGTGYVASWFKMMWWRWIGFFVLGACLISLGAAWDLGIGDVRGGGMLGMSLYTLGTTYLSQVGSLLVWLFLLFLSVELAFGLSWIQLLRKAIALIHSKFAKHSKSLFALPKFLPKTLPSISMPKIGLSGKLSSRRLPSEDVSELNDKDEPIEIIPLYEVHQEETVSSFPQPNPSASNNNNESAQAFEKSEEIEPKNLYAEAQPTALAETATNTPAGAPALKKSSFTLPSTDLLQGLQENEPPQDPEISNARGLLLMECLNNYGIQGTLVRYTSGPVVTLFEVRPAAGVKVGRVATLDKELAMALKAVAVRIQAPVPGSDTIGFEVPNDARAFVSFRELLEAPIFSNSASLLTLAIGKDIGGHPVAADLARMPHLLVAGSTGAGKSVCLNAFLLSLLYKATPDDLKLLLIDPKRVELAVYADLPHLVHPVVTESLLAKTALEWAVYEMDRRYTEIGKLSQLGVRNYVEYHQRLAQLSANKDERYADLEPFPYLVIIIDELADLMYTAGKDVQTAIVRLAQLARAAGIHLIVATQRPSVDVVTGLIKANFPCRISFQVTSKHDSSTILDVGGAERLLGKGDMLYKPSGAIPQRLHGAYVSDEEVMAVVDYWKAKAKPDYAINFEEWGAKTEEPKSFASDRNSFSDKDENLYLEILAFSKECNKNLSISLLQRQFSIGFNKAARFMDRMEAEGYINASDRPNRPRV